MKISLTPRETNMAQVAKETHLNYQTVMKLTKGTFAPQTFRNLAIYLEALGYTPETLSTVKISEIFTVK